MRMLYVVTLLATVATSTARDLCGVAVNGTTGMIGAGSSHTCARNSLGAVACWGRNDDGQLGDGSTTKSNTPVPVFNLTNAVAIAAGKYHTCAVLSTGGAMCWGSDSNGQLGDGGTNTDRHTPVDVKNLTNAIAITAGDGHTCALLSTGKVKCWGLNRDGQLGDNSTTDRHTPVDVKNLTNAVAIATAHSHMCALLSTGGVKCWGSDSIGQLGDGEGIGGLQDIPVDVDGITDAVAIAAGHYHTCAVLSTGGAKCWGENNYGQLGDGTNNNRYTPEDVLGIDNAVAIDIMYRHTCAVLSTGGAKCWGSNSNGQLGDNSTQVRQNSFQDTPVPVLGIDNAVAIALGTSHTCALLDNGGLKCWGYNNIGQLGDNSTTDRHTPVDVLYFDACFQTITAPFSSPTPGIHLKGCTIKL